MAYYLTFTWIKYWNNKKNVSSVYIWSSFPLPIGMVQCPSTLEECKNRRIPQGMCSIKQTSPLLRKASSYCLVGWKLLLYLSIRSFCCIGTKGICHLGQQGPSSATLKGISWTRASSVEEHVMLYTLIFRRKTESVWILIPRHRPASMKEPRKHPVGFPWRSPLCSICFDCRVTYFSF